MLPEDEMSFETFILPMEDGTEQEFAILDEFEFEGKGYGDFKLAVGEACADALAPVQAEFKRLVQDKKYLEDMMAKGAAEAHHDSLRTMSKVRRKIGFTEKPRF